MADRLTYYAKQFLHLVSVYGPALLDGWRQHDLWAQVQTFCLFIGYPRSGHTLVGALLDAHPQMVVSHELDVLCYVFARFSREQIYALILQRAQWFAQRNCQWEGYSYAVPGQWQGCFQEGRLRVLGDKAGEATTLRLQATPWLLKRLRKTVHLAPRFVHVVRNPFDNIATIAKKGERDWQPVTLDGAIEYYFGLCETVAETHRQVCAEDWYELRLEGFIQQPQAHLRSLCAFLGVEVPEDWLAACSGLVFASPRRSRDEAGWNAQSIARVRERMQRYDFLQGYIFDA
jgi:Sulfotransferase family